MHVNDCSLTNKKGKEKKGEKEKKNQVKNSVAVKAYCIIFYNIARVLALYKSY